MAGWAYGPGKKNAFAVVKGKEGGESEKETSHRD